MCGAQVEAAARVGIVLAAGSIARDRKAVALAAHSRTLRQNLAAARPAGLTAPVVVHSTVSAQWFAGPRGIVPAVGSVAGSREIVEMIAGSPMGADSPAWPVSGFALIY